MLIMKEMKLPANYRSFPRTLLKSKSTLRKMNLMQMKRRSRKKKKRLQLQPLAHRSQSETRERRTRNVEERVLLQFNPYS